MTISLSANETSDPIEVPALKLLGIDTDKPVTVSTEKGSVIAQTRHRHALPVIPPTGSIVIQAGAEGAEVELTIQDDA